MFGTQVHDEGKNVLLKLLGWGFFFLLCRALTFAFVLDAFGPDGRHCDDQ
jgi:hypothetical protein